MSVQLVHLQAGPYLASISSHGAELQSFAWKDQDLLWNGDPTWWGRRAPLLFPVVGSVAEGHIRVGSERFPMPKHGFARDREWEVVEATSTQALFRLREDEGTRAHYPFAFDLKLRFSLEVSGLRMEAELHNPGSEPLPAQFGFHSAFHWPLLEGQARDRHALVFDEPEPGALRQLAGEFIAPDRRPTPVVGRTLALKDDLFAADALIWDPVHSRGARYGVAGEPRLRVRWEAPSFACWTKPGAPFLCLEPWQGLADEVGFRGPFQDRSGVLSLAPGASAAWSMSLAMEAPDGLP